MSRRPARLIHETLLETASRRPNAPAIAVDGQVYSYEELHDAARRMAGSLRRGGVERFDRVAIFADNSWLSCLSIYAALECGATFVVINPQTKIEKLRYVLADSGARALVTQAHLGDVTQGALADCSSLRSIVAAGDPSRLTDPRCVSFEQALGEPPLGETIASVPIDLAALIYTSGTTGTPKGVMMTHQNMMFTMGSIVEYLGLDESHRLLNVLPLAFTYGLYHLLMSVNLGALLVLERSFTYPARVFQRMVEHEVTLVGAVPTIYSMLISVHARSKLAFPSVRRITNAAAALPESYTAPLREIFPNAELYRMYGQTECARTSFLRPDLADVKPRSVGKAIPGTEVYLLTPDGRPVANGEAGLLHVRGPHVMLGYWNLPEETARSLKPGRYPGERVLSANDWFRMDEDGDLYFVARADEIIKTRGEKVSPVEVENTLMGIDGVVEAAVMGVPDDLLGEAVRAFVVLGPDSDLTPKRIELVCRARLESFMVPREILVVPELPKTESGKIRRAGLRELVVSTKA